MNRHITRKTEAWHMATLDHYIQQQTMNDILAYPCQSILSHEKPPIETCLLAELLEVLLQILHIKDFLNKVELIWNLPEGHLQALPETQRTNGLTS